jgi:hypothetical protein
MGKLSFSAKEGSQVVMAGLHDDEQEALVCDLPLLVESPRRDHLLDLGF